MSFLVAALFEKTRGMLSTSPTHGMCANGRTSIKCSVTHRQQGDAKYSRPHNMCTNGSTSINCSQSPAGNKENTNHSHPQDTCEWQHPNQLLTVAHGTWLTVPSITCLEVGPSIIALPNKSVYLYSNPQTAVASPDTILISPT